MDKLKQITYYYERKDLSFSKMKDYDFSPMYYYKKYIEKSIVSYNSDESMLLGSLCHCLALTPELFDDIYFISNIKLTASTALLYDFIIKNVEEYQLEGEIEDDMLLAAVEELELFNNVKDKAKILEKLSKNGLQDALYIKQKHKNKTIISQELYNKAQWIVDVLASNEFISNILFTGLESELEIHNEKAIYWKYNINSEKKPIYYDCKSLLDRLTIDHSTGEVNIYDLKFISDEVANFKKSVLKYKYYLQAGFYTEAVKYLLRVLYPDKEYIVKFSFIVTNIANPHNTLIYTVPNMLLTKSIIGLENANISHKGIDFLVKSIYWAEKNNHYTYKMDDYENKAQKELTID